MRSLIVEDDKKIASFVQTGLRQAGFAVDHAADGGYGLHLALTHLYSRFATHVGPGIFLRISLSVSRQGPPQ